MTKKKRELEEKRRQQQEIEWKIREQEWEEGKRALEIEPLYYLKHRLIPFIAQTGVPDPSFLKAVDLFLKIVERIEQKEKENQ